MDRWGGFCRGRGGRAVGLVARAAPGESPFMRFNVDLGPNALPGPRITAAISPDGTRLAYMARGPKGVAQLATRRLDQENATALAGTDNATDPFFSPDSQWIGFFADQKMKKVSVQGGAAVTLCDALDARGASWGADGNIIFTPVSSTAGLSLVSEAGGAARIITKPAQGEFSHRWPQILPGGDSVLFTSTPTVGNYEDGIIEVLSLKTGRWKQVQTGGYFGRYLDTSSGAGHLVYIHQHTMFGAPFDLKRMEVKGTPVPLAEELASSAFFGSGQFEASRNGTMVYSSGESWGAGSVVLLNSAGVATPLLPLAAYNAPRFSPDGKRLAAAVNGDIQIYDREHNRTTRVTFNQANNSPFWAPDGRHIVFRTDTPSSYMVRWIRADGAGEAQTLIESKNRAPALFLGARRDPPCVRRIESGDGFRSLDPPPRHYRSRPSPARQARAFPANLRRGSRTGFFARWKMDRLLVFRIGPLRDLCAPLSRGRRRRQMADLHGRRPDRRVVPQEPAIVFRNAGRPRHGRPLYHERPVV